MNPIIVTLLLAIFHYANGSRALGRHLSRRQGSSPVALWDPCNYPSQGINGPLPCASGSECICKDETYSQCREPLGGSWAPDPSWQCQQPGDAASDNSNPTTPSTNTSPDTSDTSPGTSSSSDPNSSDTTGGDTTGGGTTGGNTDPNNGTSQAATIGDCTSASAPGGWDGVASTSYYGWQGSACDCGQNSWEWATGSGVYNGAVNQKLFAGTLNGAGQPNCGSACGTCYELSTSGFNAYNGGVASGSTITLQVIDACYGAGGHWCGSTSDDYKDSSSCSVHFDIQTGGPGTDGSAAVGADGTTWNYGGQIVYYRQTSCPQTLASGYKSSCTC